MKLRYVGKHAKVTVAKYGEVKRGETILVDDGTGESLLRQKVWEHVKPITPKRRTSLRNRGEE